MMYRDCSVCGMGFKPKPPHQPSNAYNLGTGEGCRSLCKSVWGDFGGA